MSTADDNYKFRMYMFITLSNQAEQWGLALKGTVAIQRDFKMRLNNFLESAAVLRRYCSHYAPADDVDDVAETFSRLIEKIFSLPAENRVEAISLLTAYATNKIITIEDNPDENDKNDNSRQN